ncbi:rhodanese-like domain-containing protein [uncultured Bacteroides sp.]|uniref:rhodanese-like domain-containing protein n=1 Tax=uncultured Bacteroides sp. TaxID=162156 RepID=UPI00267614A8|nr:rhodanese-like domain-containing protein [uncultured Bacteroides sp.]
MVFKMNQWVVGLFLFLSSLFSCQQKGDFKSMDVEEFDAFIRNEDVQRLDVRTLAEYSEGHIVKTININVMDDSFAAMADSLLQKDKPVAVYCRSGKRSKKAATILSGKGYKVFELDKGFNSWQAAGKEIEH